MSTADEDDACPICLDALGDAPHALECGHTFHAACLVTWLRQGNPSCPACRSDLAINIPGYALAERASRLRRVARGMRAPADLKRIVTRLQSAETAESEARRDEASYRREHRQILQGLRRRQRRRWHSRMRVHHIATELGTYASATMPLPALVVRHGRAWH